MAALAKVTASTEIGDTASSASGGREVDVDVVQGRSGAGRQLDPPSGTSSARCFPPWCPAKTLLISGRVGDLRPHLFAEHRQSSTGEYHTERGQDRDQRAAAGSGVLSARLEPATDRCSVVLDAGVSTEMAARQSPLVVLSRPGGGGRGLSRPDLEITVRGVPEWGPCPRSRQSSPSTSTGCSPGRGGALPPRPPDLPPSPAAACRRTAQANSTRR